MTLPQLLEPYIIQDNQAVTIALQHGRLPYTEDQGNVVLNISLFQHYKDLRFTEDGNSKLL